MENFITRQIIEHFNMHKSMMALTNNIQSAANMCWECINKGGKILIFGNGGSAADAQHIAAELTGRYKLNRRALAAIALTTDTSALTAIGNDFSFEEIFRRQVEALAKPNDLIWGISTSGNSMNVIKALELGKNLKCKILGFSGKDGGLMRELCDILLLSPSNDTPRIQEMHILMAHIICDIIEKNTQENLHDS